MIKSLANTATSRHWVSRKPGNFDRLNTRAIFDGENDWDIPVLAPTNWIPDELIAYNASRDIATAKPSAAVHFFLDDYRFEVLWNRPEQCAQRLANLTGALTPDFSMWTDMPRAMQLWQVYRNRWCGAWLGSQGLRVIPTIGWSDRRSYPFAFRGVTRRSVVAISAVGVKRDRAARALFLAGYEEMLAQLSPSTVLTYGTPLPEMEGNIRAYPTRWR